MVFSISAALRGSRRIHGSHRWLGISPDASVLSIISCHSFSGESTPPAVRHAMPTMATSSARGPSAASASSTDDAVVDSLELPATGVHVPSCGPGESAPGESGTP
jgi:hypothetical protein